MAYGISRRKETAHGLVWTKSVRATIVAHAEELIVILDKIVAVLKKHDRGGSTLTHLAKKAARGAPVDRACSGRDG